MGYYTTRLKRQQEDNIHFLIMIKFNTSEPKQSVELWKTMFPSLLIWGTYIWGVLLFEWVLIFEKSVAIASMGTYICGVLVFDGYLHSREHRIVIKKFIKSQLMA